MFWKKLFPAFNPERAGQFLLLGFLFLIPFSIAGSYLLLVPAFLIFLFLRNWHEPLFNEAYQFCFLIFALFSFISSFFAFRPALSFNDNRELLLFLLFPLFAFYFKDQQLWRRSLNLGLISFALAALSGIAQAFLWGVSIEKRIRGFTSHWLTYSGLLMLVFVYWLIVYLEKREKRKAFWQFGALFLIGLALLLSLTRSVWIAAGLSLALYLFFHQRKMFFAFLLLTVIVFLLSPLNLQKRVYSIVDPRDPSNQDRLRIYYSGFKIILNYPLLGVGSDNLPEFIAAFSEKYKHPQAEHIEMHLHNTYLQIFAERGLFALLGLLSAFFLLLRKSWLSGRKSLYGRALFFTLIAFLLQGLFEYNFGDSEMKFLLFYLIAFTFSEKPGVADEF